MNKNILPIEQFTAPCHLWQGFFPLLLFLISHISANPQVGLSITTKDSYQHVTIYANSTGYIKSGMIECKYTTLTDIDQALLRSPVSAISLGASIDRINQKLTIFINTTKQIIIDGLHIIIVDIPLSDIQNQPVLTLLSASFTNPQGASFNADILPFSKAKQVTIKGILVNSNTNHFLLLNGRCISQKTINSIMQKNGNFIPIRYLKQIK